MMNHEPRIRAMMLVPSQGLPPFERVLAYPGPGSVDTARHDHSSIKVIVDDGFDRGKAHVEGDSVPDGYGSFVA